MPEQALAQAEEAEEALSRGEYLGPLHGIPIGIKDNIATGGITTTLGTKVLRDHVPDEDAEVVRRCKAAGAIIIGKENLEEFAAGATSNNPHYGAVHTPGMSTTSPAAPAEAAGPTWPPGSPCLPRNRSGRFRAAARGLVRRGWAQADLRPGQPARAAGHQLQRRPHRPDDPLGADSALVLQAIAGYDPLDPSTVPVPVDDYALIMERGISGLTMGIPSNYYYDHLDPEVEAAVRRAIAALEELGVATREVSVPSMQYAGALRFSSMADSVVTHEPYITSNREDYGPDTLYRTLAGQFVLGRDYSKAMKVQRIIKEEHARVLQTWISHHSHHASTRATHRRRDHRSGGTAAEVRGPGSGHVSRNTSPMNATGSRPSRCPAASASSACPSASSSSADRGRRATCSASPTPTKVSRPAGAHGPTWSRFQFRSSARGAQPLCCAPGIFRCGTVPLLPALKTILSIPFILYIPGNQAFLQTTPTATGASPWNTGVLAQPT